MWTMRKNPADPTGLPPELVARCIAMSTGTVVDPNAGYGTVITEAKRAGRDWLAADPRAEMSQKFNQRVREDGRTGSTTKHRDARC